MSFKQSTAPTTYDAANRLISVTAGSDTTSYSYDGDGNRISQTVNSILTTYVLNTATSLTMALSETSNYQTSYYWQGLDTLAQSDGTTPQYFQYDGLGSVKQLVDSAGSVSLAQTFDPYGNPFAKAGSATTSLGFSGEQTDSNGFVFLRARYYNPSEGRFFQTDPSRLEQNPYLYSMGNPVMFTDPTGLSKIQPCYNFFGINTCSNSGAVGFATTFNLNSASMAGLPGIVAWGLLALTGICVVELTHALAPAPDVLAPPRENIWKLPVEWQAPEPVATPGPSPSPAPAETPGPWIIPTPTPTPEPRVALYHYGTLSKIQFILASQTIPVSDPAENPDRAKYGIGVYFTELVPGSMSKAQLARRIYGSPFTSFQIPLEAWVFVDLTNVPLEFNRPHVYRVFTETPLPVAGKIMANGITPP